MSAKLKAVFEDARIKYVEVQIPRDLWYAAARVRRSSRGLVHCIAACRDCDWQDDEQIGAARAGTRHVRETGHTVTVDQGIVYTISIREAGR